MASQRNRKTNNKRYRKERRIIVRGVRRDPPDIRKLSKALIALAMAEAEREAQADREAQAAHDDHPTTPADPSPGTREGGASDA